MKLNFAAPMLDMKGNQMKDGDEPVTLGSIVSQALLANFPDEQHLSGPEKQKRFKLALTISFSDEQDLSVEQVSTIKAVVGKAYGPLIVGRAYELLDPTASET